MDSEGKDLLVRPVQQVDRKVLNPVVAAVKRRDRVSTIVPHETPFLYAGGTKIDPRNYNWKSYTPLSHEDPLLCCRGRAMPLETEEE